MTIERFILEQPAILEAVLRDVPPQVEALGSFRPAGAISLVGSGTSLNALTAVAPLFARFAPAGVRIQGPLAFLEEAETGRQGDLTIVLSQTGTSTTTVEATKRAQARGGSVWTLTADRRSPIAGVARHLIEIPMGPEPVGPKTKGYTASLLALILLARSVTRDPLDMRDYIAEMSRLIVAAQGVAADLAQRHGESDCFLVMGQGRHYATALEGSLKITEMSGRVATGFDTEEAFHGRLHGLGPASVALFVTETPVQHRMATQGAAVLSDLGVPSYVLNLSAGHPGPYDLVLPWPETAHAQELDLLCAIVPFQWFACELAKRRGWPPERMRYPDLSQRLHIKIGHTG
jgi:fructoselysine-6-P-deglycase FrlB-like protein